MKDDISILTQFAYPWIQFIKEGTSYFRFNTEKGDPVVFTHVESVSRERKKV